MQALLETVRPHMETNDMSSSYGLSTEQYQLAEAVLDAVCKKYGCGATLGFLIDSWPDFVKLVEQGYRLTINNYANDLDGRQILELLLLELPEPIRRKIAQVLQPWDRIFIESTLEIREEVFPSSWSLPASVHRYYRVPKKLDMADDEYDLQEWLPY